MTWFYFKRQLLSILMSIRPSRPPFKGGFCNKNTPFVRATKINKNQGDILLFGQKNIASYISAQQQNKEIDNNNKRQLIYKSQK